MNGLYLIKPTSIVSTGTGNSSSISANGSITFSSCESLSLNGVFSADYDNYLILGRYSSSQDSELRIRFRAAGTDNATASSYTRQYIQSDGTAIAGVRNSSDFGWFAWRGNTQRGGVVGCIYGPFLAQPTAWRTNQVDDYLSASIYDPCGTHNQSVSYDGFTFSRSVGTFTGLVAVYGMVK